MPPATDSGIWLGRPEERELRKLWTRRMMAAGVGFVILAFVSHQPSAASSTPVAGVSEVASLKHQQLPLSLKHRNHVRCATGGVNEVAVAVSGQTCWNHQRMTSYAAASGLCYFVTEDVASDEAVACYKTMEFCLRPLRLITASNHRVYSVCADADPFAAMVSGGEESPSVSERSRLPVAQQLPQVHGEHNHMHEQVEQDQQKPQQQQQPKLAAQPADRKPRPPPPPLPAPKHVPFVTVAAGGRHFERNGQRYRFVGTTLWYATSLAMKGAGGDRARLGRELDKLRALGVRNIRIMASSEGDSSVPYHIIPSITPTPGAYDRRVLEEGLDYVLSELGRRGMLAVLVLTNGLPWSGGLAQYVAWATKTRSPFSIRNTDWDAYWTYVSHFWKLEEAQALFESYVKMLVARKNSITGIPYANDETIMAWEIANEPRGGKLGVVPMEEYQSWLRRVAQLIKSLDSNHLVALGSDGTGGGGPFRSEFDIDGIDYTSIHIWPERYNWHKASSVNEGSATSSSPSTHTGLPTIVNRMKDYMSSHLQWSEKLRRPMVVEAFGLARQPANADGAREQTQRDAFFHAVLQQAEEYMEGGRPLGGVSFWAWGGEGGALPIKDDGMGWREGNPIVGDPPSERQGMLSVFSTDTSTIKVIEEFSARLNAGL